MSDTLIFLLLVNKNFIENKKGLQQRKQLPRYTECTMGNKELYKTT